MPHFQKLLWISLVLSAPAFAEAIDETLYEDLYRNGFTSSEVAAVAESVVISKELAVQSFVDESNANDVALGDSIRRESHGKGQGCLRAKVEMTAGGPGVFKKGATYPAWIRLSNGGAYQRDDKAKHISRGFALKLLGVDGTAAGTQDFLFITSPRFFIRDLTHYPSFLRSTGNGRLGLIFNLLTGMSWEERSVIFHRLGLKTDNLLDAAHYSAVPYRYGDKEVVKYALAPCYLSAPPVSPESKAPSLWSGPDYLEDNMNATLASADPKRGVCYGFYVQRPRSEKLDPIENPTSAWEGAFERVATITIPAGQERGGAADYKSNDSECERMAFDPFNAVRDNEPVGKVNWTRKAVYKALAEFRRVEFPKVFAEWQANPRKPAIPRAYKKQLARLKDPQARRPEVKDVSEPRIDEGFRKLGIAR